jgi:3-methyladenine DNA glycosylase AlkC
MIVHEDLKAETITTAKMRGNRLIKRRKNLKLFLKNVWTNVRDISYEDSSKTTKLICQKESTLNRAAMPIKHKYRKIGILTFAL